MKKQSSTMSNGQRTHSAQMEDVIPYAWMSFKNEKNYKKKFGTQSERLTLEEMFEKLYKVQEVLQTLTTKPSSLVIERERFESLLMMLVVSKPLNMPGLIDKSYVVAVGEENQKLPIAAREIMKIVSQFNNVGYCYEDFQKQLKQATYPDESERLLRKLKKNSLNIKTNFGPLELEIPKNTPRFLPSAHVHRFKVSVNKGVDFTTNEATVCIESIEDSTLNFVKKYQQYKLTNVNEYARYLLIDVQKNGHTARIDVRIPQISIFLKATKLPALELDEIVRIEATPMTYPRVQSEIFMASRNPRFSGF